MFGATTAGLALSVYILALFLLALWVEKKTPLGLRLAQSPLVYSLTLGVYCTSWTFYGNVGLAANLGLLFVPVSLGPTLAAVCWPFLLPRMIRLKNTLHITSIADFLGARYGKSPSVAGLASVVAMLGVAPYLALQLKSVIATFAIVAGGAFGVVDSLLGPAVALVMILFTIVFGMRRLDPTERHPGMMAVVAAESAVKLLALSAVGLFVTFSLGGGFTELFSRAAQAGAMPPPLPEGAQGYLRWTSFLILSASAVVFLPRQFHAAVVESPGEGHVRTAMWVFPLYLFGITLFVLPIALQGMIEGLPRTEADTYVLRLPMLHDRPWLALLVFLGGFSASAGMIMVATVTLATMAVNHLLLPLADSLSPLRFVRRRLLGVRRAAAVCIIALAAWFESWAGEAFMLADMGMIAFAAVLQFAPATLLGLFWRGAGKAGALLGIGGGFAVWLYTMLLPALVRAGGLPGDILAHGPLGLSWLRPEALFGLGDLDRVTHAVFWSLTANMGCFLAATFFFRQADAERRTAETFVSEGGGTSVPFGAWLEKTIPLKSKARILTDLLSVYFPGDAAAAMVGRRAAMLRPDDQGRITVLELAELRQGVEADLAGAVGSGTADQALSVDSVFSPAERRELSEAYGRVLAELRLSPAELVARIDFHRERERLMRDYSRQLEVRVEQRTRDLATKAEELTRANARLCELDRLKSAFLSSVSHELRTPLTSILGFVRLLVRDFRKTFMPLTRFDPSAQPKAERAVRNLDIIRVEAERLTQLIDDVLDLTSIEDGRMAWRDAPLDLQDLALEARLSVRGDLARKPELALRMDIPVDLPHLWADRDRMQQVVTNLVHNAVKFSREGEIVLRAWAMPDGGIRISVSDNGPGVPEEDRERVFEKFYQQNRSGDARDKPAGTGLGLSICRGVVTRYGGRIRVEPRPGGGSVFIVDLPPAVVLQEDRI
ncbi:ATP-binding protein [Desulfolutivibrio sulfoxidireducens]|uniref:ATP-binding protein n=1 Tax=Desulfolutivibrio sulfoxidireducens TaxID=2773299 RepID=UPI00159E9BD9|nr:ATP-binding protein [Desulfolutivibrio sulfoxidireducens]QLA18581.1 histidine kinase [Desulfolutivibrio sulfoxidireducens]